MKPLHVGLLVAGAALAAGLALKMTQPLAIPAPAPAVQTVSPPAVHDPPVVVSARVVKPSPIPRTPPARAAAPEPVYDEPPKIAIRKNKPISIAAMKPTQWTPGRYQAPAEPVSLHPAAPQAAPQTNQPPTPVAPPVPAVEPAVEKKLPPPRQATLRTGMTIPIRLDESLSIDRSLVGGTFQAALAEPLVADGFVIAERGARVTGRIVDSQKAGRFTGTSRLQLGLTNLMTSDGQQVSVSTDPWMKLGDIVPSETVIRFRLTERVTITERQIARR